MPNAVGIPLILMQCTDELYCVTTMSSFHRPSLTQEGLDLSDALQLLESFKRKKNTIAFRFYFSVLSFVQIFNSKFTFCISHRWNIDCIEAFDFTDFSLEANLGGDKFVFKTGFVLYQTGIFILLKVFYV